MDSLRIGLATSVIKTEHDPDEELQLEAFASAGHSVEMVAWDDQSADVTRYDAVVLRSTWNYPLDPAGFLDWCEKVDQVSTLVNPLQAVRWNIDKVYLSELEAHGIATVPTVFIECGQPTDVSKLMRVWGAIVVKPRVSAGSLYTERFEVGEEAKGQAFLDKMVAERHMMVQPYLRGVETMLEHSMVVIGDATTHVISKQPRFADDDESVSEAMAPSEFERTVVADVLAALAFPVSYARIDLMPDEDGNPLVSEVELIEPSLFFAQNCDALPRFVSEVTRFVHNRRPNHDFGAR